MFESGVIFTGAAEVTLKSVLKKGNLSFDISFLNFIDGQHGWQLEKYAVHNLKLI